MTQNATLYGKYHPAVTWFRLAPQTPPYGAEALIYSIWGTGSLSLCPLTPSTGLCERTLSER